MNILFTDKARNSFIKRTNHEIKSAAELVSEHIPAILNREEPYDRKETSSKHC